MKKLMQISTSRKQLLLNTINHFNINNRCKSNDECVYRNNAGMGCAIGREISDELAIDLDTSDHVSITHVPNFEKLPRRLRVMGRLFLYSIQVLHDEGNNWNDKGLSFQGIEEVKKIIKEYDIRGIDVDKLKKGC